jgi:hypothetical protein
MTRKKRFLLFPSEGNYLLQMYMDRFVGNSLKTSNSTSDYGVLDLEGVAYNIITKGLIL